MSGFATKCDVLVQVVYARIIQHSGAAGWIAASNYFERRKLMMYAATSLTVESLNR